MSGGPATVATPPEHAEELELKSYNHLECLLKYFDEDEDGRDLLIKTEQGYIQCHKLLLAAASPFFYQILVELPSEDPALVLMPDTLGWEMSDLVSTLYTIPTNLDPPESFLQFFKTQAESIKQERLAVISGEGAKSKLSRNQEKQEMDQEVEPEEEEVEEEEEPILVLPDILDSSLQYYEDHFEEENSVSRETSPVKRKTRPNKLKGRRKLQKEEKLTKKEKQKKRRKRPVGEEEEESRKENDTDIDIICHLCGIRFLRFSSLSAHLQMKCGNVCEICKTVFNNRREVKEHLFFSHHKILKRRSCNELEKPFQCDQCDKSFTKLSQLKLHLKMHLEPPLKFQCQDCGRFLSTKLALKKHISLHRPPGHQCPICSKLFHNKSYLSRHAISQHGEQSDKKHRCDMCDKGFNNKLALEGHKNWHLNLKPYQCRWCIRSYQNTSNVAAHERKAHREEYESALKYGNRKIQTKGDDVVVAAAAVISNPILILSA